MKKIDERASRMGPGSIYAYKFGPFGGTVMSASVTGTERGDTLMACNGVPFFHGTIGLYHGTLECPEDSSIDITILGIAPDSQAEAAVLLIDKTP